MISYNTYILDNGLQVVCNSDPASQMAAVNLLYKVGARNENPSRTGFAHLFEHLMFKGTKYIGDFDAPLQMACGENNAFTNNDYTDYYITLPKENIETALWLESDRMANLDIDSEALESEKKVVIEEYNERYLNQPYGRNWLYLRDMAYKTHPYRWATIGLTPEHIAGATLDDVRAFYKAHYAPDNAILSICADLPPERMLDMAREWFGDIPARKIVANDIPVEPQQTEARRMVIEDDVPSDAITIAFHMGERMSRNFYFCDFVSDILAGGTSARLYGSLVRDKRLFSRVNAYITGDVDPGLFVVTGRLLPEVDIERAEAAIWDELNKLKSEPIGDYEMTKVANKFEAGVIFGELNPMNRAMNLGFYSMLGDLALINREVDIYRSITPAEIMTEAAKMFTPENSSTLIYLRAC